MLKVIFYHKGFRGWLITILVAVLATLLIWQRPAHTQTGPVELIERRTLHSKTFRNPNGSFTLKSYAGPVHYHDAAGRLQDFNLSLRSQVAGEYAHVADGAPFSVRAGWHAAGPLRLARGQDYVVYRLLGASALATGAVSGPVVRYRDAFLQTDVHQAVTPYGLKEILSCAAGRRRPPSPT